jgi:hypothetical protein
VCIPPCAAGSAGCPHAARGGLGANAVPATRRSVPSARMRGSVYLRAGDEDLVDFVLHEDPCRSTPCDAEIGCRRSRFTPPYAEIGTSHPDNLRQLLRRDDADDRGETVSLVSDRATPLELVIGGEVDLFRRKRGPHLRYRPRSPSGPCLGIPLDRAHLAEVGRLELVSGVAPHAARHARRRRPTRCRGARHAACNSRQSLGAGGASPATSDRVGGRERCTFYFSCLRPSFFGAQADDTAHARRSSERRRRARVLFGSPKLRLGRTGRPASDHPRRRGGRLARGEHETLAALQAA